MKEGIKLQISCIDYVAIQCELKYLIGVKVEGTTQWKPGPVHTQPRQLVFSLVRSADYQVRFLSGS